MKPRISTPTSIIIAGVIVASAVIFNPNLDEAPKKWAPIEQAQVEELATSTNSQVNVVGVLDDDHIRGDENASVVIVAYSDLECPFCKTYHAVLQKIFNNYKGKVAWVYRHYPIDQLHSKARSEANATECAYEQGGDAAFWKYTDELFKRTPSNNRLDPQVLIDIAKEQGLNVSQFANCQSSGKYASKVEAQFQSGVDAGARGTPYSVLVTKEGTVYPVKGGAVSYETLKATIDKLIK